jgi:PAS domain S-box-containing protein
MPRAVQQARAGDRPARRQAPHGQARWGRSPAGRLAAALEQQRATAEILRAISSATADLERVFEMIAERAVRLCDGQFGGVFRFDGEQVHLVAQHGLTPEGVRVYAQTFPDPPGRDSAIGRAILDRVTVHIPDVRADPGYGLTALAQAGTMRCIVAVPVLRDGQPIGGIVVWRSRPRRFAREQVALLGTFADQALIAIENVRLVRALDARTRDLTDALDRQTATSEVLKVISRSAFEVGPVLEILGENATRLCQADAGIVFRLDEGVLRLAAEYRMAPEAAAFVRANPFAPDRGSVTGRAALERRTIHVRDTLADPEYRLAEHQRHVGYRTALAVPMLRGGALLGVFFLWKTRVDPFSDSQIELVTTFADQAVIAIENVRLFSEVEARNRDLAETLDQQTATAEILRIISSSLTDVQPVLDAVAESTARLCDASDVAIFQVDGDMLRLAASRGALPYFSIGEGRPVGRDWVTGRAVVDRATVQVHDLATADAEFPEGAAHAKRYGHRTTLATPLLREGLPIGAILLRRLEVRPFTDKQIELLNLFADQAVIAIENVRLFTELGTRNRALAEALEQQTATSEILRVISSSPTDIQPVFDTIGERARRLSGADISVISRFDGQLLQLVELHGVAEDGRDAVRRAFPMRPDAETVTGRTFRSRAVVHVADVLADPDYEQKDAARSGRYRGCLGVPMLREGQVVGVIFVSRERPGLFSDTQVDLLGTFADQAVIAIENVRLFKELEAKNRDLTETLEQQTATSAILRVIASSPTDIQPVLDAVAENAARLCEAFDAQVLRVDGDVLQPAASFGPIPNPPVRPINRGWVTGRAVVDRRTIHVHDLAAESEAEFPTGRETQRLFGHRTTLATPLLREGQPLGAILIRRMEVRPFSEKQIKLLETFADQAVIAIENVRLFKELEAKNRDLTESLEQQTATSELLKVIGRSTFDLQPVFEALAESAVRLCEAKQAFIFRFDGEALRVVATQGASPELRAFFERTPIAPGRGSVAGRTALERRTLHVEDVRADSEYTWGARQVDPIRTVLTIPMLRAGELLGVIGVNRHEVRAFSSSQVALLETFADQAAIAIENARLLGELRERTAELTRSVGELRALGEVSRAVGSTLDLPTVLTTIVDHAVQLAGANGGVIYEYEDATGEFHLRASHRMEEELVAVLRDAPIRLGEGTTGRAAAIRAPVQIEDIRDERQYGATRIRTVLARLGYRSVLAVPLLLEQRIVGALTVWRQEAGRFAPEVVNLLQTFAAQSGLAIHNARLFREIERQKQYSEALVETSPVAIVTVDLRGTVAGWNPGAERLFGYAQSEALGRPMEDLVATPEGREEVRANIRRTLAGEGIRAIGRRARKDGTPVDVEISSLPVVVDGARVGMIGIYHDITELLAARREAEAANEAKSSFLATMSHEIRTPMNAVIGMSGLLLGTALTDEQREYAEVVRQSGDALLTVINDILDFSKIEAGKLELESRPFDLRECVEGALDLVASRAAEKGLDLAYLLGDETPPAIVGDVTRLRQVLLNLLSNAVKFTERGEVVLSVTGRPVDGATPLHEVTFSVRDTGIGIPPDRLDRLFRSFSQVDASTTRRYGGTGLGLAISRRLVELMGGRIEVASELGRGSEFRFTVRAAAAEGAARARRDLGTTQPSLSGKRVLVVDDNATNRRILAAHLDLWGMPARATGSPGEALAWIAAGEQYDVAILDMHMPEMDGVALARAIRGHAAGAALPLILFTSLGRREARAEEAGFAAYLHKPIKPSQLFDALVSVLAERPVAVRERGAGRGAPDPQLARRPPLRILLAEDNVVNQKVALRLLGQMGYRADVAADGVEAIAAVERQTYDVVLMDVQMPELDGFEASREINRRWPGERRPRIVAMTANAMQGDRELCVAAGMDDYVSKPIRVEELVAALERCRPRPETPAPGGPAAGAAAPQATPGSGRSGGPSGAEPGTGPPATGPSAAPAAAAIDRAAFERLVTTMGGAFVAELCDTFLEDGRELIATLRRALATSELDAFRRAAHSLKSNSDTLGATALAALARELEATARAGSLAGAGDRLEPLEGAYGTVARALGELRRGLPA